MAELEPQYQVTVEEPQTLVVTTGIQGPPGAGGATQQEIEGLYASKVDFITEDEFYRGEAEPGSSSSGAVWRIRYVVIASDGDIVTTWADGNSDFDNVWDDRLSLTYS